MSLRRVLLGVFGVPLGLAGVVAAEAVFVVSRDYLPSPDYMVTGMVEPIGATSGPAVRLAVLGDSTAAGIGATTVDESLALLIAERVAARLQRPVTVTGYGVSGARTDTVRDEQVPLLEPDVDAVVLVVGSNDVTHATPWWQMDELTRQLLVATRAQVDAPVVLGGIPRFVMVPALPQPLRWLVDRYAVPLRQAQQAASRKVEGARFVDIAAEASPRFFGRPESMSSDGFHPSPLGYGFWADALAPAVADAIVEAGS